MTFCTRSHIWISLMWRHTHFTNIRPIRLKGVRSHFLLLFECYNAATIPRAPHPQARQRQYSYSLRHRLRKAYIRSQQGSLFICVLPESVKVCVQAWESHSESLYVCECACLCVHALIVHLLYVFLLCVYHIYKSPLTDSCASNINPIRT